MAVPGGTSPHSQCWHPDSATFSQLRLCIADGHPVLVLMRGVPGSGKSHLARSVSGWDCIVQREREDKSTGDDD